MGIVTPPGFRPVRFCGNSLSITTIFPIGRVLRMYVRHSINDPFTTQKRSLEMGALDLSGQVLNGSPFQQLAGNDDPFHHRLLRVLNDMDQPVC